MAPGLEGEIDRLYQLPLDAFTGARNALAKQAGGDGAAVRQLAKPNVAAWAVNQLYWQRRDVYDALIEAATAQRAAHAAVLSGKRADLRAPGQEHERAVEAALKATLALLQDAGSPATDATRQAIATTLRALPAAEPPGRLTRTLQPGGFEALAGIPVRQPSSSRPSGPAPREKGGTRERTPEPKAARDAGAVAAAKEALVSATRTYRVAEHTARREEFDAARAARQAEKAARALEEARKALQAAEEAVAAADRDAAAARREREAADRRARDADAALKTARTRMDEAQRQLEKLQG